MEIISDISHYLTSFFPKEQDNLLTPAQLQAFIPFVIAAVDQIQRGKQILLQGIGDADASRLVQQALSIHENRLIINTALLPTESPDAADLLHVVHRACVDFLQNDDKLRHAGQLFDDATDSVEYRAPVFFFNFQELDPPASIRVSFCKNSVLENFDQALDFMRRNGFATIDPICASSQDHRFCYVL